MPHGGNEGKRSKKVEDIRMKTDEVMVSEIKGQKHTQKIHKEVNSGYLCILRFWEFFFKVLYFPVTLDSIVMRQ